MNSLIKFFMDLTQIVKLAPKAENLKLPEQRQIISKINEYLYTNYKGIGTTFTLGSNLEYFSEFHKFWKKNHRKILNPKIDEKQCEKVAEVMHNLFVRYGRAPFSQLYDKLGLKDEEVCKIRFFTANQEFRGTRKFADFAKIYQKDPSLFDVNFIGENPETFLGNLKLGKFSQTDKRINYAKISSGFLLKNKIEPIDLLKHFDNDFAKLRDKLINTVGSGYGQKKTDMFLRDMYILEIWKDGKNFDLINVASDINTIKVALRARILKTEIVLLSSFLDIFCYQYSLLDEMNAKAWRRVWEIWVDKYPEESIESPCLMDYLIFRLIGKEICKEKLALFQCDEVGHEFFWHSSRNRTCQTCYKQTKIRKPVSLKNKFLPCKYEEGSIFFENNNQVRNFLPGIKQCPFVTVCDPNSTNFHKLNPPKSISILGRTGWESAKTRKDEGGGGLMA